MPCFTASNVRFISAEEQMESPGKKHSKSEGRSQTPSYADYAHYIYGKRQQCMDFFRPRGSQRYKPVGQQEPGAAKRTTLTTKELERMQNAAKYVSVEERLAALERQEQLARQLDQQAERARVHFKKIDEQRLESVQLQSAQEQANELAEQQLLLEKAFIEKYEQEEEVKAVNRIILNAKSMAMLDAQIKEKNDIQRTEIAEKVRLEKMVLENVRKELEKQDCYDESKKQRNAKYAREIREQLDVREGLKYLEAERAEEEAKAQRRINEAIKRDEERQVRKAWERRQKFRDELNRVVEMSNLFKKMLCEQEREADMRIAAYLRERQERQKQLEHEKQLSKEEFERKQQHLYQLAEKRRDSKSQRDEGILLREQERVEREYRRTEREGALRKKQIEREMQEARERQMQETKSRQALQLAREEKDFNELIDTLKKEEARLKAQEEERAQQRKCYRSAIIRQISDKVMAKRRLREDERTNANVWRKAERQRLDNIRVVVNAKLTAMREACLPERYIRDVERQLDRIIKSNAVSAVFTK